MNWGAMNLGKRSLWAVGDHNWKSFYDLIPPSRFRLRESKKKLVRVRRVRAFASGADAAWLMRARREMLGIDRADKVTNDRRAWGASW
jgi:hypothetical protein